MSRSSVRDLRHVSLARTLHTRLYVNCEGRVFAVGGRVIYDKLKRALAHHERRPSISEAPAPHDLGVDCCDGELSPHLLHCIGRALHRWRLDVSAEMQRKPAKRWITETLTREQLEIERLSSRLTNLRKWQAELADGRDPSGAPLFLDSVAETALQAALENAQRAHPLTPLIAWQARVVSWLSGESATRRFLSATIGLLAAYPKQTRHAQVHSFQQAVIVWKQRGEHEQLHNFLAEIAQHLKQLSPDEVRSGRFPTGLGGRTFQEYCDHLLWGCSQLLLEMQRLRCQVVPAAIAALAAADRSTTELPQCCFRAAAETEDFPQLLRILQKLAEQIGQPGYGDLLLVLNQLPGSTPEFEVDRLRQFLAAGNSLDDAVWACEQGLLNYFVNSYLSIPSARRISAAFTERGCPLTNDHLRWLPLRIRRKADLQPVDAWLAWLGSVSPRAITPRIRTALHATFWDRYLPSVQEQGGVEQLAPCLATVRRTTAPEELAALLDRITASQRLAGRNEPFPKSLRTLLGLAERRLGEHQVLRARQAAGTLDPAAQRRLQHLQNDSCAAPSAGKLRRAAEQAFLLVGIDGLAAVIRQLVETNCRTHLGGLVTLIAPDQYWSFAHWMHVMSEAQRDCLRELIAAHDSHGRGYKRALAQNQDWLGRAVVHGVDLDPWLNAEQQLLEIGGQKLEITVVGDLRHIFLMGVYFHTCLSLGDCNEMSVLANGYDANKQVVFMFTADDTGERQVIARQLLAITSDFKLVGYCYYVNSDPAGKPNRPEVETALASYCGRLAAQCHLELADEGAPEPIGDHFWYNDGEHDWPPAARTAWAENSNAIEAMELSPC